MQEFELNAAREALGEIHAKTLLTKNNLGITGLPTAAHGIARNRQTCSTLALMKPAY
jgi:hypothetical protein